MNERKDQTDKQEQSIVLLPCPFCGGPAGCIESDSYGACHLGCTVEDCSGYSWPSDESELRERIDRWNTRSSLSAVEHFIDREIESMDESGQWSTHAIDALLGLQARIDGKLTEMGNPGQ